MRDMRIDRHGGWTLSPLSILSPPSPHSCFRFHFHSGVQTSDDLQIICTICTIHYTERCLKLCSEASVARHMRGAERKGREGKRRAMQCRVWMLCCGCCVVDVMWERSRQCDQHPTFYIQHPTSNIQHPTSNIQTSFSVDIVIDIDMHIDASFIPPSFIFCPSLSLTEPEPPTTLPITSSIQNIRVQSTPYQASDVPRSRKREAAHYHDRPRHQ